MSRSAILAILGVLLPSTCFGWGPEGHSITAEIAERRLSSTVEAQVKRLLAGASLASIASWADDQRVLHPETTNWHFVDTPVAVATYDPVRDCAASARGDCIVAELTRLRQTLACAATDQEKAAALKFAVHFVGDIHQPLHTVGDELGGNQHPVTVTMRGLTCTGACAPSTLVTNLHAVWDGTLITKTVFAWGSYVDRLENGWLASPAAQSVNVSFDPAAWANETHGVGQQVWNLTPADGKLDDTYFAAALPIVDQQLGRGGLRLAAFIEDAFKPGNCGPP